MGRANVYLIGSKCGPKVEVQVNIHTAVPWIIGLLDYMDSCK